jgi:hypothetical protein
MGGALGSGSCMVEGQGDGGGGGDDETESKPVLSFVAAVHVFAMMGVFIYAHDITERDQVNFVSIERLLFSLKMK